MNSITNTSFDGLSYQDMQELGESSLHEGGEYYTALMRHQLTSNRLGKQVVQSEKLTDTWDSAKSDTQPVHIEHRRAPELHYGKHTKTPKKVVIEPTVRLRKAMGLPLRKGELLSHPK
jgi:hypothetical protein